MAATNGDALSLSVPPMKAVEIAQGISYVQPLCRRGHGPAIVLLVPDKGTSVLGDIEGGIPSIRMKWAEEGYCVVEVLPEAWKDGKADPLKTALDTFAARDECQPKEKLGLVCYDDQQWETACGSLATHKDRFVGAALYTETASFAGLSAHAVVPTIFHLAGKSEVKPARTPKQTVHEYPTIKSKRFVIPFQADFHYGSESVAHSRNLAFLKPKMDGPYFDLESLWEEHTAYEFEARSVDKTMATMVQEPYVNNVPTLTGGIGREKLTAFYRDHFIFANPDDAELELISRTVGIDRCIDEFIFKFTFDKPIGWLFPGVPPTFAYMEIPFMAVVNFRGDRLYHEHITWDSASALQQLGLLPETAQLLVPTKGLSINGHNQPAETNGNAAANGTAAAAAGDGDARRFEVRLPVAAGTEAAQKMRDKNAIESNLMLENIPREIANV